MRLSKNNKLKVSVFIMIMALIMQTIVPAFGHVSVAEPVETELETEIEAPNDNDIEDSQGDISGGEEPSGGDLIDEGEEKEKEEEQEEASEPAEDEEENKDEEEAIIDDNLMGVMPYAEDNLDSEVSPDVITKVTAKKGNNELKDISNYRPMMGEKIDLFFEFKLDTDHKYGDGSKLTFPLPNPLKPASGSGALAKDGEEYAEYKIEGGNVVITFNEKIRFYGEEGSGGLETIGDFKIEAEYSAHGGNTDLEQELKLPGSDDITLNFKPKGGKVIEEKEVTADNGGKNSQYVEWTVNVNTEMEDLGSGKELKDTLTGNHKYDEDSGSYSIERYEVDSAGNKGTKASVTLTPNFASDGKSFTLNLTGKYAYEIKYRTIPGDTEEPNQSLDNKAEFGDVSKSKNTTISYGDPLTKEVSKSGEVANWTITVNKNRRTITSGTTITDTWTINADKHKLVGEDNASSFTVDGLELSEYEITDIDKGFTLTLKENVNKEFTIRYSTEPRDLVTGNISLTNNVVRSDRRTDIKPATASYNQQVLTKSNSELNYQDKTAKWTINLNSAGYTMPIGTVITDDFVDKNLKIKDGTFTVAGSGITLDDFSFADKDSTVGNGDKKGGFTLTSTKEITGPIIITYVTDYDVKSVDNLGEYRNQVGVKWDSTYEVTGIESKVTINNQQKAKGYKTGSYNYENKEFNWAVGINYNFDTIDSAVFTDTLPETQVVDKNDVSVYKLNLNGGGDGTQGALFTEWEFVNSDENVLKIKFNDSIDEPYRIVYKSKDKDDYYAPKNSSDHTTENHKVENKAILEGTGYDNKPWKKEVEVKHSNKLITKKHDTSKYIGSAKLAWEMNLNWSQSKLSDVKIIDEIGLDQEGNPNQKIYEDSFKIYEMNFSGVNSNPSKGTEHKPGEGLYDVNFSPDGSTFEIVFNGTIDKAYRVEYESYFLGESPSELKNIAKLSYTTSTSDKSNDQYQFLNANFTFSGSASNKKGLLEITKVDKDDPTIKLSGAVFELHSAPVTGGFLIERVSEDTDGVYKFKTKVGQSDYYLIETEAPEGYSLDASDYKDKQKVTIDAEVTPITVKNTKIAQGVELTKIDETNPLEKLTGAEFTLHNVSDDSKVDKDKDGYDYPEYFTTVNGKITVGNLSEGDYYFKEIKAPDNYVLPTNVKTENFTIIDGQIESQKISKTNKQGKGSIIVTKVDKADETILLDGVEFRLTNDENLTVGTEITNSSGIVKFENIPYGKYTLTEISAHDDYVIDENPIEIILDGDIDGIEIDKKVTNSKKNRIAKLIKYNANKTQMLKGATFELRKENNGFYEVVTGIDDEKLKTDENGEINLENLDVGKYQLIEIGAPSGYTLNKDPVEFEIEENQIITKEVEKTNSKRPIIPAKDPSQIKIIKIDSEDTNIKLKGAEFEIKNSNGEVVEVITTNSDGEAVSGELEHGNYLVVEITAPEGYELTKTEHKVTVNASSQDIIELNIENEKTPEPKESGKIKIIKTDSTNNLTFLTGAIFDIKDSEGQVVETLTTNIDGTAISKELPLGTYKVIETKAPAGYELSDTEHSVVVSKTTIANDKIVELKVTNVKKVDPEEPNKPDPEEPEKPSKPDPEKPGKPDPEKPTDPEKPGKPDPEKPTDPEKPGKPDPEKPTDPEKPGKPDPEKPTDPEKPGKPDPEKPTDPEKPGTPDPEKPTDPDQPGKKPEDPIKEETPKDTPKEGDIEVPEGSTVKPTTPPKNGTVTVDPNGKWTYTPNPGYVGKDSFVVTITHPDGTEEDIYIEIDVGEAPLGTIDPEDPTTPTSPDKTPGNATDGAAAEKTSGQGKLPKTGETSKIAFYLVGLLLVALGIFLNKKRKTA